MLVIKLERNDITRGGNLNTITVEKKFNNIENNAQKFYYDFSNIENLENVGYEGSVKAEFFYNINGQNILQSFSLTHVTSNLEFLDEKVSADHYLEFRFGHLIIEPEYRNQKLCSFIMSSIILNIISRYPNDDICFALENTSDMLGPVGDTNNLKIYDTILTEYQPGPANGTQYRIFKSENRSEEIGQLKTMIKKYQEESDLL
jgi:hypothetical protein